MKYNFEPIRLKLLKQLKSIGYSYEQFESQINELGKLISQSIFMRVVNENIGQKEEILDDFEKFIKSRYHGDEFNTIVSEETIKIISEFVDNISKNLDETRRNKLIKDIIG